MSALSIRLEKAAARIPPIKVQTEERPQISLHEIIEKAKAEAAFLETATPLQLVAFHRGKVARLEAILAESTERTDNSMFGTLRKVQKVWLPSFLEDERQDLHQAELAVLKSAGFTSHTQPGAREHLELELFAA